jgi:hypothetical protein
LREEGGAAINCHEMRVKEGRKARECGQARPELRRRATERNRGRKGGGRKEKEAPTCGTDLSAAQEKKKRQRGRGPLRGKGKWAGGPLGRKVR